MEMINLPEDLFIEFMRLSSMKARAVVQTCVLTKKWKNLWAFLPDLNFSLDEFNSKDYCKDQLKFSRFVTTVLENRKTSYLDKFRLSCEDLSEGKFHSYIKKWIMYALKNKVRVLELAVCMCSGDHNWTPYVFACDSLEELHLHLNGYKRFWDKDDIATVSINIPRLRKLHLYGEGLKDGNNFFKSLISGCPLLEDLCLELFYVPYEYKISSEKLKHLTLKHSEDKVVICAPSLVSFCFFGTIHNAAQLDLNNNGLISPSIHASLSLYDDGVAFLLPTVFWKILPNVEYLELCVYRFHRISYTPYVYYPLPAIKILSFCGHSFDYFTCLWKYLPNLEKLTLWLSCQHSHERRSHKPYYEGLKWDDSLRKALIPCEKLKVVEVVFRRFDDKERQLVDDLSKLENVKIVISNKRFHYPEGVHC